MARILTSEFIFLGSAAAAGIIPPDRLPPGGVFQAGVPGGVPKDYAEYCDVTVRIPGSALRAAADGVSDDSDAINAALGLCPAKHYVFLPAGNYRINHTLRFPNRSVVLRGAGSQTDPSHTNILCYAAGTAVSMDGRIQFGGWFGNLVSGYDVGSTALTFSSRWEIVGMSVGDLLLVVEDYDAGSGVTVGGAAQSNAGRFPRTKYQWKASPSVVDSYYVEAAGGGNPHLTKDKVRQVFYSPKAGTEAILTPTTASKLTAGQWCFGDFDSLGFGSLYVCLPGKVSPATLPAPGTDGAPDGGVWYNPGIQWGGANLSPAGPYVHDGQGFRIKSVRGATVTLDRPFYWSFSGKRAVALLYKPGPGTGMGLEDLGIQVMQARPSADAVVVQRTVGSWVRNVEVKNASKNFILATNTMDCEFRHNYVHEPWDAQGGSGYGFRLLGWNFNNLVEDNIAYFCRHSYVLDGMDTGCVVSYNFSLDPNDNANGTLPSSLKNPVPNKGYLYQDFLTHGSNPRFCLWEGNVGGRAYCDFVHGSANYLTYFRNHFRLQEGHILAYTLYLGSEIVDFDRWNYYMSVVGNILGYPAMQADQLAESGHGMVSEGHYRAIYRLGYNADDNANVVSDLMPKATLLRHGNYDYVNNAVVWDPSVADHNLPDSLYLNGKPDWFGSLRWPPVDPMNAPVSEQDSLTPVIPAMYRFMIGTPPNGTGTKGNIQGARRPGDASSGIFRSITESNARDGRIRIPAGDLVSWPAP
jgi:hypothetical protein